MSNSNRHVSLNFEIQASELLKACPNLGSENDFFVGLQFWDIPKSQMGVSENGVYGAIIYIQLPQNGTKTRHIKKYRHTFRQYLLQAARDHVSIGGNLQSGCLFYTVIISDKQYLIYLRISTISIYMTPRLILTTHPGFAIHEQCRSVSTVEMLSAARKDAESRLKSGEWRSSFHPVAKVRT